MIQIAAIVLAAGEGRRFSPTQCKLMLTLKGEPVLVHVIQNILSTGFSPIITVLGARINEISPCLEGLPVQIVSNPHWENGQSTSLIAGLQALPADVNGVCCFLGDQPLIQKETLLKLKLAFSDHLEEIIVPLYDGKRGNPVIFPSHLFKELQVTAKGDQGGRALLKEKGYYGVAVTDKNILRDIDTLADYNKLLEEEQNEHE